MKKALFLFSFLLTCFFTLSSFESSNVNYDSELAPIPCDPDATVHVVSFMDDLVFSVQSDILDSSYTYNWEITRYNGTVVYGSGNFFHLPSNCAFGYRVVSWKVTVVHPGQIPSCQTKLQGSVGGTGIC